MCGYEMIHLIALILVCAGIIIVKRNKKRYSN